MQADQHLYPIPSEYKSMVTADYYYTDWECLIEFFAIPGWKIACMTGGWTYNLRLYLSVRCLWPLIHGKPYVWLFHPLSKIYTFTKAQNANYIKMIVKCPECHQRGWTKYPDLIVILNLMTGNWEWKSHNFLSWKGNWGKLHFSEWCVMVTCQVS